MVQEEKNQEMIPQEPPIEVTTVESVMNRQDYKALRYYFLHKMKPYRMRNVVIALIAGIACICLGTVGVLPWLTNRIGLYGLFLLILVYLWIDAQASKLEKPVKSIEGHKQILTFAEDGFRVEWIDYSVPFEYTWDLVAYAFETEDHFFFFVKRLNAIILPKREVEEEKLAKIRELVETKIIPLKDQIKQKKDKA